MSDNEVNNEVVDARMKNVLTVCPTPRIVQMRNYHR